MTEHPIALHLGWHKYKNYLLLHSVFTFALECSVLPIQFSDVYSKNEANKKDYNTTKTVFGKDQRMPVTGYISYASASDTHKIQQ